MSPIINFLLNDDSIEEELVGKNILLIIADDLGVDNVSAYEEQPNHSAQTPNIDSLTERGLLFRNTWANPQCSPTRASLLTGRHAFRHGVTHPSVATTTLSSDEETAAEILSRAGYQTGLFGKWHLGTSAGTFPTDQGFDTYSGNLVEAIDDYYAWEKTVITSQNGTPSSSTETRYATEVVADESVTWINQTSGPWFAQVAFNAPHAPFHVPAPNRYTSISLDGNEGDSCTASSANDERADCYRAAVEAMDSYIGEMLSSIDPQKLANTVIIFVGDNGTPGPATIAEEGLPFASNHAKSTVYEGGVNVPLIISAGSNVVINQGEVSELIQIQDVFSTMIAVAKTQSSPDIIIDGINLEGHLDPSIAALPPRETLFTELTSSIQGIDRWAHSDGVTKYVFNEGVEECYDLLTDPGETDPSSGSAATCEALKTSRPTTSSSTPGDNDGDNIADADDSDRDGDGIGNLWDTFPNDANNWADTDNDGIGDNTDSDIDGDGINNALDVFPYNANLGSNYVANRHSAWKLNTTNTLSSIVDITAPVNVQSVNTNTTNSFDQPSIEVTASGIPDYTFLVTEELLEYLNTANPLGRSNGQPAWRDFNGIAQSNISPGQVIEFGQDINFNSRLDTANNPGCSTGAGFGYWPPGPGCPVSIDDATNTNNLHQGTFARTPVDDDADACFLGNGKVGFLINGVAIYGYTDALSYDRQSGDIKATPDGGDNVWHTNAPFWELYDVDACGGHAAAQGKEYHHHGWSQCLGDLSGDTGATHSPIIGFMADGYALHGPWHNQNQLAKSAWVARDYNQNWDPENGEFGCNGDGERTCLIVDPYDPINSNINTNRSAGPSISDNVNSISRNILVAESGAFLEDFYIDSNLLSVGQSESPGAQLDENNGHSHGDYGYHYHVTITHSDSLAGFDFAFPYTAGPQYKARLSTSDGIANQCVSGL